MTSKEIAAARLISDPEDSINLMEGASLEIAKWAKQIAYQLAVFNEGMARLCSETKPGVADEQIHLKVQIDERQA